MTTVLEPDTTRAGRLRRIALPAGGPARLLSTGLGILVLLSISRTITGADDLTSSGAFGAAMRLAVPVGLAGLGGLYAERSGVVNIGLEGMMILGTWGAGWGGYMFGGWWGLLIGIAFGSLGGLLHALATVTFGVDQIVSGVAINILAPGVTRFLAAQYFEGTAGGSATLGPNVDSVGRFTLPILSGGDLFGWQSPDLLGSIEDHHWFLVSDAAGLLRGLTANVSYITMIAVAIVPLSVLLLWRTPFGLRLRSIGENPFAADSLGVNVYRIKYQALLISGGLAGMGGAFLVLEQSGRYQESLPSGTGFIGLAALIFGNWMPWGVAGGAGLFGFAQALQLRSADSVRALLLAATIVLVVGGVLAVRRGRVRAFVITAAIAAAVFAYFLTVDVVPREFTYVTPYVTTLLVLGFASQRLRPPKAAGKPWRKGQAN
jgi:simple sugar transport system permease protein